MTDVASSQQITPPPNPDPQSPLTKQSVVSIGEPQERVKGLIKTPTPSPSPRATSLSPPLEHHIITTKELAHVITKKFQLNESNIFFISSLKRQTPTQTSDVETGDTNLELDEEHVLLSTSD